MAASPMVGAGHHVRAKTNTPIIGILTQPIPEKASQWNDEYNRIKDAVNATRSRRESWKKLFHKKAYVENSHIQFLEGAGARVVPVDFE